MVNGHDDFSYDAGDQASVGAGLTLSVFANRASLREELREDAIAAGFNVRACESLQTLLGDELPVLGEVALVDCPAVSDAGFDALGRLDGYAARTGTYLIISTSLDALDSVYVACVRSEPEILVSPTRAERVVALGRVLSRVANARVRELSETDRVMLLRLTEQVDEIAERLERAGALPSAADAGNRATPMEGEDDAVARPSLPDPKLVRRVIEHRQRRARFFDSELFADPVWDMLLDLTAARAEHVRVPVTSLCIASGVPPTTALRWIGQMVKAGLVERIEDEADKRRAFIILNDKAANAMAHFFAEVGDNHA